MEYVWLSRTSAHTFVGLLGKIESLGDDIHFLAVVGGQIGIEQLLEGCTDHFLIFQLLRRKFFRRVGHHDCEIKGVEKWLEVVVPLLISL